MSSKISRAEPSPKPVKAASKQTAKDQDRIGMTQNSYDNAEDIEDASVMRRNFNEAFNGEETQIPGAPPNDRIV